ncbi:hypothetical protein [Sphingomonas koreensis]|nr:hypothetical protein [Sphingomonas koreensis]
MACERRWARSSMTKRSDLADLKRLAALCEARERLAWQEEAAAHRAAEAATHRRVQDEEAVDEAQQRWQRNIESTDFGPELAGALGERLIERVAALEISTHAEAEGQRMLAACEATRRDAGARLRQVREVASACRHKLYRQRDGRELATVEDRLANRWTQA